MHSAGSCKVPFLQAKGCFSRNHTWCVYIQFLITISSPFTPWSNVPFEKTVHVKWLYFSLSLKRSIFPVLWIGNSRNFLRSAFSLICLSALFSDNFSVRPCFKQPIGELSSLAPDYAVREPKIKYCRISLPARIHLSDTHPVCNFPAMSEFKIVTSKSHFFKKLVALVKTISFGWGFGGGGEGITILHRATVKGRQNWCTTKDVRRAPNTVRILRTNGLTVPGG